MSDDSEEAEEVEDSGTMMPEDSKSKQEMIAEERKNK